MVLNCCEKKQDNQTEVIFCELNSDLPIDTVADNLKYMEMIIKWTEGSIDINLMNIKGL